MEIYDADKLPDGPHLERDISKSTSVSDRAVEQSSGRDLTHNKGAGVGQHDWHQSLIFTTPMTRATANKVRSARCEMFGTEK